MYTDQMGRRIALDKKPERIISIVPSQSELLWDMGIRRELAGITKFCIHPQEMFRSVTHVGGTKKLNLKKIRDLAPDLIIGNKEENSKEQIEELEKEYPVWMSDIRTLEDALSMMRELGKVLQAEEPAGRIAEEISFVFREFRARLHPEGQRAAYLIWKNPLMAASTASFIGHMIMTCGFENIFSEQNESYPVTSPEELRKLEPDLIFLSSEPFPFSGKHIPYFREICPGSKIMLVDGELFSWYGSRLLKSPEYFSGLLNACRLK